MDPNVTLRHIEDALTDSEWRIACDGCRELETWIKVTGGQFMVRWDDAMNATNFYRAFHDLPKVKYPAAAPVDPAREWDVEAREALTLARSKPWGRRAYLSRDLCYVMVPSDGRPISIPAEIASVKAYRAT